MKQTQTLAWAVDALREQGLGYPESTEDFPWGHRALKVKGKAFAFLALETSGCRAPSCETIAACCSFATG